jgi:hypothetical protein
MLARAQQRFRTSMNLSMTICSRRTAETGAWMQHTLRLAHAKSLNCCLRRHAFQGTYTWVWEVVHGEHGTMKLRARKVMRPFFRPLHFPHVSPKNPAHQGEQLLLGPAEGRGFYRPRGLALMNRQVSEAAGALIAVLRESRASG